MLVMPSGMRGCRVDYRAEALLPKMNQSASKPSYLTSTHAAEPAAQLPPHIPGAPHTSEARAAAAAQLLHHGINHIAILH